MPVLRIGLDESGKGDFFGPLVVAAVCVENLDGALAELKDAKKLKDEVCLQLDNAIRATCPSAVVTINPAKYNELHDKVATLNTLLAWGHAKALETIFEKVDCRQVLAKSFADFDGLSRHLQQKGLEVTCVPNTSAEADGAVAAASIVARAEYIRRLKALSEKTGVTLPKGANWNAVDAGTELVKKFGKGILKEVAKTNFRTVQEVLKKARGK